MFQRCSKVALVEKLDTDNTFVTFRFYYEKILFNFASQILIVLLLRWCCNV